MGYMKIKNLYNDRSILDLFKEVYCLEKIHGTSANISYKDDNVNFFAGGISHKKFIELFDKELLLEKFRKIGKDNIIIYGEAYGGKCQKMSNLYGKDLKFITFDIKIDSFWLSVEEDIDFANEFGLEFVDYLRGPATEAFVNQQRDKDSTQAIRNGLGVGHKREGVVVRPIIEVFNRYGNRFISKHKTEEFNEKKSSVPLDIEKQKRFNKCQDFAKEFVVEMKLNHIINKIKSKNILFEIDITQTGLVIKEMISDIKIEDGHKINWNKDVEKSIGKITSNLFKKYIYDKNLKII